MTTLLGLWRRVLNAVLAAITETAQTQSVAPGGGSTLVAAGWRAASRLS